MGLRPCPAPYTVRVGRAKRYTEARVVEAVRQSRSLASALSLLGLVPAGGNYATIRGAIAKLGLDTSHWRGQGWARGESVPPRRPPLPLSDVLTEGSTYPSHKLKNRMLRAGLLKPVCAGCGHSEWQGTAIPLELHHRNGVRTDNRIWNLCLLCPNCHALTSTYRGRNIGGRAEVVEWHTHSP
jgi:hypothetical protein